MAKKNKKIVINTVKKNNILQKRGLYIIFEIFSEMGEKILLKDFFKCLNKTSYYNSFYRVKERLIEKKLIEIDNKTIILTPLGKDFYNKLKEIREMI